MRTAEASGALPVANSIVRAVTSAAATVTVKALETELDSDFGSENRYTELSFGLSWKLSEPIALKLGYEARMNSDEVTAEIATTRELAGVLAISGTPTFVMQDELLRGYLPLDQMQAIVADKRG